MPGAHRTVTAILGVVLLASCGSGSDAPGPEPGSTSGDKGCGPVVIDPLDPRGNHHLLSGAPPPSYATDPPTSGPHLAGEAVTGLQTEPLEGPAQVRVLELGGIVVQFRPDVPAGDRDRLARLAGEKVVVAPNPSLSAPVVATAWRRRLACRAFDLAALQDFIAERQGKGPG